MVREAKGAGKGIGESVRQDLGPNQTDFAHAGGACQTKALPDFRSAINDDHYRRQKDHKGQEHLSVPATVYQGTHV